MSRGGPYVISLCRLWFLTGCLAGLAACSAPKAAWHPDADPAETGQWARDHLNDPELAAEARRQMVWLCLLWSQGCPEAVEELMPRSARRDGASAVAIAHASSGEAAWLGAWLGDGALHGQAAAQQWLRAAELLQPLGVEGDRAATQALWRAVHHGALAQPLGNRETGQPLQGLVAQGAAAQRVQRAMALARLGVAVGQLPADLTVVQQVKPWSRRLMSGLDALRDGGGSAAPPAWQEEAGVPLPIDVSAGGAAQVALAVEHPGIQRLQVRWRGGGALTVGVRAERQLLAWLDGERLDHPESGLAATVKNLSPGQHRLDVLVAAAADGDPLWLAWLADAPPLGAPAPPPAGPELPPELDLVLQRAGQLLADPAVQVLNWWQQRFPKALLPALRGLFAGSTPQGGEAVDQVRAAWPLHGQALLLEAQRHLDSGNPQAALEQLDLLAQPAPRPVVEVKSGEVDRPGQALLPSAAARLARVRALQLLGLPDLGHQALAGEPVRTCAQRQAVWELALEFGYRPLLRSWAPTAMADDCPHLGVVAAQLLQSAGESKRSADALALAATRPALARQARQRLLQTAALAGEAPPQGPSWLSDVAQEQWQAAQQAWLRKNPGAAQRALGSLVTAAGPTLAQRQQALRAGAVPPWTAWLRNGSQIAAQADDPQLVSGARLAWLLDQEVVVLLPGGGAIRRVHQVLRVLADDAAEAVGEVRIAQGADLELARTLLADGTALPPADTADKETVSLRGVEAGTAVEYAQIVYVEPEDPATGATRLDPFLLQAYDGPIRESELVVLVPDGVTATLEASAHAPAPDVKRVGEFTVYTYRAHQVPRARQEPRAARAELAVASVRLSAQANLASVVEPWQEALAAMVQRPSAQLQAWQEQAALQPEGRERWQALARRIAQHVKQQHEGGLPGSATAALDQRQGDRAALFYALARRLGADACLVRLRPLAREPASLAADPLDWPMELVVIRRAGTDLWYDPGLEGGLIDHVRAGLRGRPGLLVGCQNPSAAAMVTVPPLGDGLDIREISGDLVWSADGAVTGHVQETLGGGVAALIRQFLASTPTGERDALLADLAGSSFPGLKLSWLGAWDLDSPSGPLVLRYGVTAKPSTQRETNLDLGLYPAELGKTYAGLPQRRTDLLLGYATDLRLQLRVHSLGKSIQPLGSLKAAHRLLQASRTTTALPDGLQLDYRLAVTPGLVGPEDYPAAAQALRAVDTAEQLRLSR